MFLDASYFTGNLSLPMLVTQSGKQVGVSRATQTVGDNTLEYFIDRYEREFLRMALGYKLSSALIAAFEVEPVEQKWTDLRDAIYMRSGRVALSPAANYIYFFAMKNAQTNTAMVGEVVRTESFSNNESAIVKLNSAWNDIDRLLINVHEFLCDNWELYKDDAGGISIRHILAKRFGLLNMFGL